MARDPGDISQGESSKSSGSDTGEDPDVAEDEVSEQDDGLLDIDQEYHTEESDTSLSGEDEERNLAFGAAGGARDNWAREPPLLPTELLRTAPNPVHSFDVIVSIPWNQMTRKQKRAERLRSRKIKKREWERMYQEASETGALKAGRIAQLRRGIVKAKNKIKDGRVEKQSKPEVSGREKLLQGRKRVSERSELMRPPKKSTKAKLKR